MRAYSNYQKGTPTSDSERLPVGGYILKILKAEEVTYSNGGRGLKLSFDIAEGEHKDFYKNNYNNQIEPKKWKGVYNFSVPDENSEEKYRRAFENRIACITESNPGYEWDFDETKLKGKLVGAVFGNQEYEMNGNTGFFTKCFGLRTVSAIREGRFRVPADRLLDKKEAMPAGFYPVSEGITDDDLPF